MNGIQVADGDICSGAAPIFKDGSTVLSYSYGLASYWNSGCLKEFSAIILPTFSNTAGNTHNITMTCCGSWPSPSARTITEVYNQACVASFSAATSALSDTTYGVNLSGTWAAWLDSAANTNNNNYRVSVWLDGGAGKAFKISTRMSQTKTGSPETFLVYDWYVVALNDASGNLGGLRILGAVRMPAYNTATERKWRAFAPPDYSTPSNGPNLVCNAGTPIPLPWLGSDGNPMVAQTVTATGGNLVTSAAHNYYLGASANASGNGGTVLPCYFTTTGTLPTSSPQINTTEVFYLRTNQNIAGGGASNHVLEIWSPGPPQTGASTQSSFSTSGTGTHTIHPLPIVMANTRLWFADSNGRYVFVQGTGTLTAETTNRVMLPHVYAQSTGVIPSYDLSVNGASVSDTDFDEPTPSWTPFSIGTFFQYQQQVGEHNDLGPWPEDAARWFFKDTKLDDLMLRMEGLSAGHTSSDFKDPTLDTVVNIRDPAGTSTYTGLANSVASTLYFNFAGYTGGASPGATGPLTYNQQTASHGPNYAGPAYVKTGELQYIELMIEQAVLKLIVDSSPTNRNVTSPDTMNAILMMFPDFNGEPRTQGWGMRDIAEAAGRVPFDQTGSATTYDFGGTQVAKYIRDIATDNIKIAVDAVNPANNFYGSATTYITNSGFYPAGPNLDTSLGIPGGVYLGYNGYEFQYTVSAFCFAAALLQDANAKTFLNYFATQQNHVLSTFGGFDLYSIASFITSFQAGNFGSPVIPDDNHWGMKTEEWQTSASWSTTPYSSSPNRYFTITPPIVGTYVPAAGDMWMWQGFPPTNFTAQVPYFVRDVLNTGGVVTLNLAATSGGSAIVPGNSGTLNPDSWHTAFANAPADTVAGSWAANGSFVAEDARGDMAWAKAILGTSVFDAPLLDATTRLTASGWTLTAPSNGVRYSMQTCFGHTPC